MSLVTEMLIADKYGLLLGKEELAELLGYESPRTVENLVYAGDFPIPTTKQGRRIVAHYTDVAAYIDSLKAAKVKAKVKAIAGSL